MKKGGKWILFIAALIMIAYNLLTADFSAYRQLSAGDLIPVAIIALGIFLLKTGVLSAVLLGIKKLWDRIRRK